MCGRFTLTVDPTTVQLQFALESLPAGFSPRYNIAPTQPVLALTNEGTRDAALLRWGLIPSWAKDPAIGSRMINARAETLAEKPAFRHAFRRRRCAIFADGFYEWQKRPDGSKTPLFIHRQDRAPFAFAGLWEAWKPADGEDWLRTCTIITTEPNDFMLPIHDRMPVILDQAALDDWLTPGEVDPLALHPLLKPFEGAELAAYEVSRAVNSPRNDSPDLVKPLSSQQELL
ncbi:MAG: SOS response-associated peptidase [Anaerolineae bacterium]|nr:SOS response-associated peptidase [Anaerolineae bacterium]